MTRLESPYFKSYVLVLCLCYIGSTLANQDKFLNKRMISSYLVENLDLNGGIDLDLSQIIVATKCIWDYSKVKCDPIKNLTKKVFIICMNHPKLDDCLKPIHTFNMNGAMNKICILKQYLETAACKTIYENMLNKVISLRNLTDANLIVARENTQSITEAQKRFTEYQKDVKKEAQAPIKKYYYYLFLHDLQ